MKDNIDIFETSLAKLEYQDWLLSLDDNKTVDLTVSFLGANHASLMLNAGKTLFVHFENYQDIAAEHRKEKPSGWTLADNLGWSCLSVISKTRSRFRDEAVINFFDTLVDDGSLDQFEQVVFYGVGPAGYAAAAFSVVAPLSTVIVNSPFATLDPVITPWDRRNLRQRKVDFRSRYCYAPDMVTSAERVILLYNSTKFENSMHAALFHSKNVERFNIRLGSSHLQNALLERDEISAFIETCATDNFQRSAVVCALKTLRNYRPYLLSMLQFMDKRKRPAMSKRICTHAMRHCRGPNFRRRLDALKAVEQTAAPQA